MKTVWLCPAALLLGWLQALAFDGSDGLFSQPFLSPLLSLLSLIGFLYFIQKISPKKALLFGYFFGLAFFGWGLNWVYISMASYGGAPLSFALLANAGVVAYLSLYWLIGAYVICRLTVQPNQRLLLAAPVFAILEWIRSFLLIGFPWLSIGYAWIDTPLALLASFGGVFLLSFISILSAAVVLLATYRRYKFLWFSILSGLITLIHLTDINTEPEQAITLALVQGNMPVITEYDENRMNENLVQYAGLTERLLTETKSPIDLVIWPESAIAHLYDEVPEFLHGLHKQQRQFNFELISGIAHGDWQTNTFYNAVLLQSTAKKQPDFYFKQHLLPFGEYLPFRSVFSFFEDYVDIPMSDFSPGPKQQLPFDIKGKKISPSICFEAVFGDEIRQNANDSDLLLNISNDAWFGRSKAQIQHLNIARMRAIENRKTLIRATNNGITALISPQGRIQQALAPFQAGVLVATVYIPKDTQPTVYARLGDKPWIVLFVIFAGFILFIRQSYPTH